MTDKPTIGDKVRFRATEQDSWSKGLWIVNDKLGDVYTIVTSNGRMGQTAHTHQLQKYVRKADERITGHAVRLLSDIGKGLRVFAHSDSPWGWRTLTRLGLATRNGQYGTLTDKGREYLSELDEASTPRVVCDPEPRYVGKNEQ